jgi:hypothetical protein
MASNSKTIIGVGDISTLIDSDEMIDKRLACEDG